MHRVIAVLTSLGLAASAFAADHRDSPLATGDPAADINDVYTFVNPRDPGELIVAVTVSPFASSNSRFSDAVDYRLHIDNGTGEQVLTCRFPGSSRFTCTGLGNLAASGSVGRTVDSNTGLRVYTGLRDDPFFFDLNAFNATRVALAPRFNNPGSNFFSGNTLAMVFGIPVAAVNNGANNNVLKIYASTVRTGGDGISAGISGSWYDPNNPGHGYYLEVIRGATGALRLNALWAIYDGAGNQQYFLGVGEISGNRAVVPVIKTVGGSFPPPFNSAAVQQLPAGTLTFDFTSCNGGSVRFNTSLGPFSASGTVPLTRLTAIAGVDCSLLSKGQIDRNGRPAINPALINLVPASGTALKDAYNRAEGLANWTQFIPEMEGNLAALDTLDGVVGNNVLPPAALAPVLNDDRLVIDVSKPNCNEYLAVELGVPGKCGGRTLPRDVIDDTFGAVVGPGVSDNVADDSVYLDDFPFLGEPI